MTKCSKCQLWEDNCLCPKCPSCKKRNYSEITRYYVKRETLQRKYYIEIMSVLCNKCFNIFGIEV